MDPDAEVQAAITDVFAAFRAGGSAFQVVVAFKDRLFPKRAYGGVWAGQLRWGRLTHSRVVKILENPLYAGAYVYGRAQSRRVVEPDGTVRTKVIHLAPGEVAGGHPRPSRGVCELGRLSGQSGPAIRQPDPGRRPTHRGKDTPYVRGSSTAGPAVIACRPTIATTGSPTTNAPPRPTRCTHRPAGRSPPTPSTTRSQNACSTRSILKRWRWLSRPPTKSPTGVTAASRAAELAVERARYEAERAERAFHACEPDNRLVARNLESALGGTPCRS